MQPAPLGAAEPRLDRPLRAVVAVALFLPFVGVAFAYHDGLLDVDATQDYENDVSYRFKGRLTAVGGDDVSRFIDLQDDVATRRILWNATAPDVGQTYVVVATFDADRDALMGDAVGRVYFFR